MTIILAIRARPLRRHTTVRLVWLYLATSLPLHTEQIVKVGRTATLLGLKKARVRMALQLLVRYGYLESVRPATAGTPGSYRFGPKATGPVKAPDRASTPLPLFDQAA